MTKSFTFTAAELASGAVKFIEGSPGKIIHLVANNAYSPSNESALSSAPSSRNIQCAYCPSGVTPSAFATVSVISLEANALINSHARSLVTATSIPAYDASGNYINAVGADLAIRVQSGSAFCVNDLVLDFAYIPL